MATDTADAVALLGSLVDALPAHADRVFADAEAGETVIQAPRTAVAEVLAAVSRANDGRGIQLTGTADTVRQALLATGPVALAPVGEAEVTTDTPVSDADSSHDGRVVASHRARETAASITSETVLQDVLPADRLGVIAALILWRGDRRCWPTATDATRIQTTRSLLARHYHGQS